MSLSKRNLVLLTVGAYLLAVFSPSAFAGVSHLTIVHTNDVHGHILPSEDRKTPGEPKPVMGGSAYLAAYVKRARRGAAEGDEGFLLLDAGDFFHGTPEGNYHRGSSVIAIMNAMGYDAVTVGNHEFAFGAANLERLAEEAEFPFLGSNIVEGETGKVLKYLRSYIIREMEGLRVGIIGVTTPGTPRMNFPEDTRGLKFLDPALTVRRCLEALAGEKVDLVILLSHVGSHDDVDLTESLSEIDVIVGGHDHVVLDPVCREGLSGTLVCQAGEHCHRVGYLRLTIDTGRDEILDYESEVVNLYHWLIEPDPEVDSLVQLFVVPEMDSVVGFALTPIRQEWHGETVLGDWITDIMRKVTGAHVALLSGGGIRADLSEGEITMRDVYSITPFDNRLVVLELSGDDLISVLEQTLGGSRDRPLQFSGMKVTYNPQLPSGSRVLKAEVNGEPIQRKRKYKVATTDYLAWADQRYRELLEAQKISTTTPSIFETEVDWIRKHSRVRKAAGGRLVKLMRAVATATGKVNINTASFELLQTLPRIGPVTAERIVSYRERYGLFKSIDELMKVKGIGPKTFEKLKDRITIESE